MTKPSDIAPLLDNVLRALGPGGWDPTEIEGESVRGSYRSSLPKEGAYGIDEDRYLAMVEAELTRARKALAPLEAKLGVKFKLQLEEKGWISIYT